MGEALFLGLRLLDGVDTELFRREFGISIEEAYPGVVERRISHNLLQRKDGRISLTGRGVLLANQVFSEFV
jgi:oxygen-independent coproporphyrinogen-3 oxidase